MPTTDKLMDKVSKLLAQAENTNNAAESAAFMARAQSLAATHSIDLAKARFLATDKHKTTPIVQFVKLGERKTRGLNTYVTLIGGIAQANDVEYTIRHDSTGVTLYGFAEDIAMVEALYASLMTQMVAGSIAFKREGTWKQDEVWSNRYNDYRPISWLSARLDYQNAFGNKVGTRLYVAKLEAQNAAEAEEVVAGEPGTGLVLVEKRKAVKEFYDAALSGRRIGTYRGGRSGVSSSTARNAGAAAGSRASLGRATAMQGASKALA